MHAALLFVLLAFSPASGAKEKTPSDSEGISANSAPAPKEEKKICKRLPASESRMAAKRLCLTAAEWKQMKANEER
jgi:hypothetical protein